MYCATGVNTSAIFLLLVFSNAMMPGRWAIFLGHDKEDSFVCQSVSLVGGSGRKDKHRRQSQGFGQPLARDGASPWRGIALLGLNEQQGRALVCAIIETV